MLAEVLHFYHLGWDELLEMEMVWFCKLYSKIQMIEARRLLPMLDVLMYPQLTKREDRKRLLDDLERRAGYARLKYFASLDPTRAAAGWEQLRAMSTPAAHKEPSDG